MNDKYRKKDARTVIKNAGNTLKTSATHLLDFLFPTIIEERKIQELSTEELGDHSSLHVSNEGVIALFPYRDPLIKRMIWLLKYRGNIKVTGLLGTLAGDHLTDMLADTLLFDNFKDPLLVPIPLSRRRQRERGFNQVEYVTEYVQKHFGHLCKLEKKALRKKRETVPQTSLPRSQRLLNVKGAFEANTELVSGRNIILLDDVTTTGSTLCEARKELLNRGARKVLCLALAY